MFWIILLLVAVAMAFYYMGKKANDLYFFLGVIASLVLLAGTFFRADIRHVGGLKDFPPDEYQVACRTDKTVVQTEQVLLIYNYGPTTQAVMVPAANFKGSESLPVCQTTFLSVVTTESGETTTVLVPDNRIKNEAKKPSE